MVTVMARSCADGDDRAATVAANELTQCANRVGTVASVVEGSERSSVLTSWTATLLRALEERAVDVDVLLGEVGLDTSIRVDPERRIPLSASTRLWNAAVAATGDDAFGIDVSRYVRLGTFHGLGHAFMTSPTLRAALERAARFSRVTADMAVSSTHVDGDDFVYVNSWQQGAARPAHAAVDAAMAAIVRAARAMLGRQLAPTRVELVRPEPRNVDRFETFFRASLQFDAPENVLAFAREDAERPVPGGHDRLASIGDRTVSDYLATLEPATIAGQVRELLVDALEAGEPDVDALANELAMSGRTLQRRLQDEGTSFREVLATTRRDLAEALLATGVGSVTEIGQRVGFSETAAFSRAFRRWTGQSPASWRRANAR
jgi:AraC-like DNA-binding protein